MIDVGDFTKSQIAALEVVKNHVLVKHRNGVHFVTAGHRMTMTMAQRLEFFELVKIDRIHKPPRLLITQKGLTALHKIRSMQGYGLPLARPASSIAKEAVALS